MDPLDDLARWRRPDVGPTVAVVGGGQLARMMQPPAVALGVRLAVLAERPDDSAAQVIPLVSIGSHLDGAAVTRFDEDCDELTFDHEHVPTPVLEAIAAAGHAVRPGPAALVHAQDKAVMRRRLTDLGVPVPRWRVVASPEDVAPFAAEVGWPVVLKTVRGGYDGRGVAVVASVEEAAGFWPDGADVLLAEERVDFVQELSAQVARSPHGQAVAYPVVRTVQTEGICTEVVAPAPGLTDDEIVAAQHAALTVAQALDVVGMLAVEMFETRDGRVLVNELAMRPHNSGHWSIEGAVTSQFENHLRAVLDLPLGSPSLLAPDAVMVNVLGGDKGDLYRAYLHCMARDPGLKIHMYGKEVRAGRKLGHVTVVGDDLDDLLARAHHAADYLTGVIDE